MTNRRMMNRTKEGASQNEARLGEKDDQVQALAIGVSAADDPESAENVYKHFWVR